MQIDQRKEIGKVVKGKHTQLPSQVDLKGTCTDKCNLNLHRTQLCLLKESQCADCSGKHVTEGRCLGRGQRRQIKSVLRTKRHICTCKLDKRDKRDAEKTDDDGGK